MKKPAMKDKTIPIYSISRLLKIHDVKTDTITNNSIQHPPMVKDCTLFNDCKIGPVGDCKIWAQILKVRILNIGIELAQFSPYNIYIMESDTQNKYTETSKQNSDKKEIIFLFTSHIVDFSDWYSLNKGCNTGDITDEILSSGSIISL